MRRSGIILLGFVMTLFGASGSQAQIPLDPQFQKFVYSSFHRRLVDNALSQFPPAVFRKCPTLVSPGSRVTVIQPVVFAASGYPNAGAWHQAFPVSGCGNDTTLNLWFVAGSDEKVNTLIGAPGETRADLRLQNDTLVLANVRVRILAKDCKTFHVTHTKFDGFGLDELPDPGPSARFRPWRETWMLAGCERKFAVGFKFVQDEKGTSMLPGETKELTELK